jgi:hypothetical protein
MPGGITSNREKMMHMPGYPAPWLAAGLLSICLAAPNAAQGWWDTGHQVVAAIAAEKIRGTQAEKQVKALLRGDETLVSIAGWADLAKGASKRKPGDWNAAQTTQEMRDFDQDQLGSTDSFHFTDLAFQADHYDEYAPGAAPDDVVHLISECILRLKWGANGAHHLDQRTALLLLVHLVGDIQQPLHVGPAYVKGLQFYAPATPAEAKEAAGYFTRGDNWLVLSNASAAALHSTQKEPINFHALWDGVLLQRAMTQRGVGDSPAAMAKVLMPLTRNSPPEKGSALAWSTQWAASTLALSKQAHEGVTIESSNNIRGGHAAHPEWTIGLAGDYVTRNQPLLEQTLATGGQRLADVLIEIWPAPSRLP